MLLQQVLLIRQLMVLMWLVPKRCCSEFCSEQSRAGSDNNSTWTDLESTSFAVYDSEDNKLCLCECVRPAYRYVRAYIDLGTANTVIDGVFYELAYAPRTAPVTQPSTVTHYGNKSFVSPAAGTA
jgi:hypothetical protein